MPVSFDVKSLPRVVRIGLRNTRVFLNSRVLYPALCRWLRSHPPANCYISTTRTDGAGAQAHSTMSAMLMAHDLGFKYVHSPFVNIEHGGDDADWTEKWESHFGLGEGELSVEDIDLERLTKVEMSGEHWITKNELRRTGNPWRASFKANAIYFFEECHFHADLNPDRYEAILPKLRAKYAQQAGKWGVPKTVGSVLIAVHIRRGDAGPLEAENPRFTPEAYYVALIHDLIRRAVEKDQTADVHVFSQGAVEDFPGLSRENVTFHLDESPYVSHRWLVEADVLVMSRSSFSYTAGLLSQGIVIYQPFWHRPLSRWVSAEWNEGKREIQFDSDEALGRSLGWA